MRRSIFTLVVAVTTLVTANFAVAASNDDSGKVAPTVVTQPAADDAQASHYSLDGQLDPKLEFVQYPATSWICQTPTFWCRMVAPDVVGDSCFCATYYGPVAGYVR